MSNYNEEKVPPYTLPDPLVMASGERVTTAEQWFKERRPEILKFYQNEIYGRVPANAPKVTWEVTETDTQGPRGRGDQEACRRQDGRQAGWPADESDGVSAGQGERAGADALEHHLRLRRGRTRPGRRQGRGPKKRKAAGKPAPLLGRGPGGFDAIGEVLGRGWGYASLTYTDIQPDRADRWTEGVIGLTLEAGPDAARAG